jgi:hypothetical protein
MHPPYTVRETVLFQSLVATILTDSERTEFIDSIAANPLIGDVIPGAGGLRKVRWRREGMGKSGGARVIYFNRLWPTVKLCFCGFTPSPNIDNVRPEFLLKLKERLNA